MNDNIVENSADPKKATKGGTSRIATPAEQAEIDASRAQALAEKPLNDWKASMSKTDNYDPVTGFEGMTREIERHIRDDHGGIAGTPARQSEYDAKVALRVNKPKL